jgi:hypothetical protein
LFLQGRDHLLTTRVSVDAGDVSLLEAGRFGAG